MKVEEIVMKIRALPLKLRFHLLFSLYIAPNKAPLRLALIETYGSMLSGLAKEILNLPKDVFPLLVASELKQIAIK